MELSKENLLRLQTETLALEKAVEPLARRYHKWTTPRRRRHDAVTDKKGWVSHCEFHDGGHGIEVVFSIHDYPENRRYRVRVPFRFLYDESYREEVRAGYKERKEEEKRTRKAEQEAWEEAERERKETQLLNLATELGVGLDVLEHKKPKKT